MATDFYNEVGQIIEDVLIGREIEEDLASAIAANIITNIASTFGGSVIYLKNGLTGEIALKHEQIASEYNGRNIRQLSMKYRVSAVWIKKILRRYGK
jgi:Mor family transcriptional regulator